MVCAKQLLTVILTWLLTFVDCSRQLSIETEETTAFCCAQGLAYSIETDSCLIDKMTPRALDFERLIKKHDPPLHLYTSCESGQLDMEQLSVDLDDVSNGLMHMKNFGKNYTKNYCLYRKPNATMYWGLKCWPVSEDFSKSNIWISSCMGFATIVTLVAVMIYIVVPELKDFRGRIVCYYLISYLGCIHLLTVATLNTLVGYWRIIPDSIRIVYESSLLYCGTACLLWINVMSFDTWKTFRNSKSDHEVDADERQRVTLVRYWTYAWGTPITPSLILATSLALRLQVGKLLSIASIDLVLTIKVLTGLLMLSTLIFGIICACCTYFCVSTCLKIYQRNKEIAQMTDGVDKQHQRDVQWFDLHAYLCIAMSSPVMLAVIPFAWPEVDALPLIVVAVPLQAICVFYIVIWNDSVKRAIRNQFAGIMYCLGFCRQCHIEPVIPNKE